jgi:hypothetical protein
LAGWRLATRDWCSICDVDESPARGAFYQITGGLFMTASRHPHALLESALIKQCAPCTAKVTESTSRPWASITFTGARHVIHMSITGPQALAKAAALKQSLSCAEFDLPGHLVADIIAADPQSDGDDATLTIEALTVETE